MAQVARVAMVGALTASIAHEINQPMGAILSNAEAARMMLDQGTLQPDKLRAILTDIRDEDLRASAVIRGLRALLGRTEWRPTPLELNTEVAEALRHVAFDAARRGVRLAPIFNGGIPTIRGDATQLQQVVINLVINAMDAVTSTPEARTEIRIETRAVPDGVEVAVADHGPGLAPADASRLFQTSFTTKKDGMGFGLSIVRAIVEMHGGRVSFEPNIPRGAVFRVWLPAIGA
jgi:signal transduction histidine kinase